MPERLRAVYRQGVFVPQVRCERLVTQQAVLGRDAHPARIVAAMKVHAVTHLLTFNKSDFKNFAGITVVTPAELMQPTPATSPTPTMSVRSREKGEEDDGDVQ